MNEAEYTTKRIDQLQHRISESAWKFAAYGRLAFVSALVVTTWFCVAPENAAGCLASSQPSDIEGVIVLGFVAAIVFWLGMEAVRRWLLWIAELPSRDP